MSYIDKSVSFQKIWVLNLFCVFDSPDQSLSCGDYIEALGHEMDEIRIKHDTVKRLVDNAERQGMEATSQVK
jgi:hypothetical protein